MFFVAILKIFIIDAAGSVLMTCNYDIVAVQVYSLVILAVERE